MNLRLCLLLLNIKNCISCRDTRTKGIATSQCVDGRWFRLSDGQETHPRFNRDIQYTVQNKLEYGDAMLKIQGQFLGLNVEQDNADEDEIM